MRHGQIVREAASSFARRSSWDSMHFGGVSGFRVLPDTASVRSERWLAEPLLVIFARLVFAWPSGKRFMGIACSLLSRSMRGGSVLVGVIAAFITSNFAG